MDVPADPSAPGIPAGDILDSAEAGQRVARGGAVRLVGFGVGLVASVIASRFVADHLGPDDFGRFTLVIGLTTVIQIITDLGMTVLGLREYTQREGQDREDFMRALLGFRLGVASLGVLAAVLAAIALGWDHEQVAGAALMAIGFAISAFYGALTIPLQADLRVGVVTAIDVARQVLLAILFLVLVAAGSGIVPFLGAPIPIYVLLAGVTYWFVRGQIPMRPTLGVRHWAALVRPTIAVAIATSVGSMYLYTAVVLCDQVTTEFQTGLFSASFRVYVIVASIPALLMTIAFPLLSRAARDDRARLSYAAQKLFETSALIGLAALVACILGAAPIIDIVAGPKFAQAAPVLRVQGAALAITFVIGAWGFTLLALKLHRPMVFANLAALAASAVTVLLLARSHGALGASYGTLLGETALASGYAVALARGGEDTRPRPGLVLRAIPAAAIALLCWFVPMPALLSAALGLVVYTLLLLAFGAVPNEIRDHLPGPLRRLGPTVAAR